MAASASARTAPAPHARAPATSEAGSRPAETAAKAITKSASSSIASGAPARITLAKATPRRIDQRQRPSRTMCNTASSMKGMATNPSVISTWLTWLNTAPENANVAAPRTQATVERASARRKTYIPTPIAENRIDLGGDPGHPVRQDTKKSHEGVEGAGVEVGHQRRAAEDVLVPEWQLPVAQHGADQDMQRVVLLQVVACHEQVAAEEVRQHEGGCRDGDQDDVGPQGSDCVLGVGSLRSEGPSPGGRVRAPWWTDRRWGTQTAKASPPPWEHRSKTQPCWLRGGPVGVRPLGAGDSARGGPPLHLWLQGGQLEPTDVGAGDGQQIGQELVARAGTGRRPRSSSLVCAAR